MKHSLTGWDIVHAGDIAWAPWGSGREARAKLIASADGYNVVLVVAGPGYAAPAHVHGFPEFAYVIEGTIQAQGHLLGPGDAYAAAAGSTHTEFRTHAGATYVSIFKR